MQIKGWKYYNHAAIPTCAPHEIPDMSPVLNGDIWKIDGGMPLFLKWTSEFDCGKETLYWYTVKDAPFSVEELSKSAKKHIRQAKNKCYVSKIDIGRNINELFRVYEEAFERYSVADNRVCFEEFQKRCFADLEQGIEYWGGYCIENDIMIGYMTVANHKDYAEICTSKFSCQYLKLRVSDALYSTVLEHYLNVENKKYVTSGSRNINHITNSEEYKIQTFGYRRAYCRLHIKYNPKINRFIKLIYPFSGLLRMFDKITFFHRINAVLKMEKIVREQGRL